METVNLINNKLQPDDASSDCVIFAGKSIRNVHVVVVSQRSPKLKRIFDAIQKSCNKPGNAFPAIWLPSEFETVMHPLLDLFYAGTASIEPDIIPIFNEAMAFLEIEHGKTFLLHMTFI